MGKLKSFDILKFYFWTIKKGCVYKSFNIFIVVFYVLK